MQRLAHHAAGRAAALGSAAKWHDTIGTGLVASLDDRNIRAVRIVPPRHRRLERVLRIETQPGDALVPCLDLNQQLPELVIARRPTYQTDVRRAVEDLLAFLLRYTAEHAE